MSDEPINAETIAVMRSTIGGSTTEFAEILNALFDSHETLRSALDTMKEEAESDKREHQESFDAAMDTALENQRRADAAEELLRVNQDAHKRCDVLMAELFRTLEVAQGALKSTIHDLDKGVPPQLVARTLTTLYPNLAAPGSPKEREG